jgi:leader peptidase (prepilin peptidase) / N-methyltransferase
MIPLAIGFVCGMAALASSGRLRRSVDSRSRWISPYVHVPLAAVGGFGAGTIGSSWPVTLALGVLAVAAAALIVIDLAEFRLPDRIVIPLYLVLLGLLFLAAVVEGSWANLGRAAAASAILFVCFFAVAFIYAAGMGLGDVKLAGVLGMFLGWLGWPHVMLGTFAAFLLNAAVAVVMLALRRTSLEGEVPFGPSMIVGAAVGAAWGPNVFPALG